MGVFNGLDDLEFTHRRFSRSELIGYPEMLAFIGDSVVKDVGGFGVVLKQVSLLVFADVIVPPIVNSLHVFFSKTALCAHRDVVDGLRGSAIALDCHITVVVFPCSGTGVVNREFGELFLQLSDFCVFTLCNMCAIFRHDRNDLVKVKTTSRLWGVGQSHANIAVWHRSNSYLRRTSPLEIRGVGSVRCSELRSVILDSTILRYDLLQGDLGASGKFLGSLHHVTIKRNIQSVGSIECIVRRINSHLNGEFRSIRETLWACRSRIQHFLQLKSTTIYTSDGASSILFKFRNCG